MHDVDDFISQLEREHGSPGWYSADGKLVFEYHRQGGWTWAPIEEGFPAAAIDSHYQRVEHHAVETVGFPTRAQAARYAADYCEACFNITIDISSFRMYSGLFYTAEHGNYRVCFQRYPRNGVWVVYRSSIGSDDLFDEEVLDSVTQAFCDEQDVGIEHFPTLKAAATAYLAVCDHHA